MRKYTDDEERRVRKRSRVREWVRSGLLSAPQVEGLDGELRVDLRRTNIYLRGTLAFFTMLIVVALVGFTVSAFGLHSDVAGATVAALAAILCITAAEAVVGELMSKHHATLSVAESMTGGWLAQAQPRNRGNPFR